MRLLKLKAMDRIIGLHYAPDGRRLLAVGGKAQYADLAHWCDLLSGEPTHRIPLYSYSYAVCPDATRLAIGHRNGWKNWEVERPPVVVIDSQDVSWHDDSRRWEVVDIPENGNAWGLAFSHDGMRLAIGYHILDVARSQFLPTLAIATPDQERIESVRGDSRNVTRLLAFSPDGSSLATAESDSKSVAVVDVNSLAVGRNISLSTTQTHHVLFSPDGNTLAIAHARSVHLYPADSDVPRVTLPHPKQANSVAFTPCGRRILSTCHDGLLRIWDAATGQLVTSFDWGVGQTSAVAVSPDGLTAAAAGQKGQIAVFDLG